MTTPKHNFRWACEPMEQALSAWGKKEYAQADELFRDSIARIETFDQNDTNVKKHLAMVCKGLAELYSDSSYWNREKSDEMYLRAKELSLSCDNVMMAFVIQSALENNARNAKDFEGMKDIHNELVKMEQEFTAQSKAQNTAASVHIAEAEKLAKDGNLNAAVERGKQAFAIALELYDANRIQSIGSTLGDFQMDAGDLVGAQETFLKAHSHGAAPTRWSMSLEMSLGHVAMELGQFDQAVKWFTDAINTAGRGYAAVTPEHVEDMSSKALLLPMAQEMLSLAKNQLAMKNINSNK